MTSNARTTIARGHVARMSALLVLIVILGVVSPWSTADKAFAATGDLLQTVNIPLANQCPVGISVTTVPGSLIGENQYPILLVYSCWTTDALRSRLHFIDPSTATLVKTIETTPTPPQGWGSLSLRGGQADILACGDRLDGTQDLYVIDVNPLNATPDGTATFLFHSARGTFPCDGVAWDNEDNTIFHSPESSDTIYHLSETGTLLGSFPSPPLAVAPGGTCRNSGLAVGGASLFASCNGDTVIFQLNKASGDVITSFTSAGTRTEDLECDPISFANQNPPVDAIWSKDAFTNQIFAFEIPAGTCGFAGNTEPPTAEACPTSALDTDGDGLLDCWEDPDLNTDGKKGIDFDRDGTTDLELPDADKRHKDIYVEVDWMKDHEPNPAIFKSVVACQTDPTDCQYSVVVAFANAPVSNPDGTTGIRLHVQKNEEAIPTHNDDLAFLPYTAAAQGGVPDFDTVKGKVDDCYLNPSQCPQFDGHFGTPTERGDPNFRKKLMAKKQAFHYALFAHELLGDNYNGVSGGAEILGNDFVVTLGDAKWQEVNGHPQGNADQQAATFMHELGHNLNLLHGGDQLRNCKPNYLSVMNYILQFDGAFATRPLDYSDSDLADLTETVLIESAGIGGSARWQTAFGPPVSGQIPTNATNVPASGPINWDLMNGINLDSSTVNRDINNFAPLLGCHTGAGGGPGDPLTGYNDWANLRYNFRADVNPDDFADGVRFSVFQAQEFNIEEAEVVSPDTDGDGTVNVLDNCPLDANPGQADSDSDGIGNACEVLVPIDIKPGTFPNPMNRRDKGSTPVALLGTPDMDAPAVADPSTVLFAGASPIRFSGDKDVNADGLRDLVFHFVTKSLQQGLPNGTTEACLTGKRLSGTRFKGCDSVVLVK